MTRSADECSPADTAEHAAQNLGTPAQRLPAQTATASRIPDPAPSGAASTLDAREHSANTRTCHRASDGLVHAIRSNLWDQEFLPAWSCILPFKIALAEYLRDFHLVVLVPALTSYAFRCHVARIRPPLLQS